MFLPWPLLPAQGLYSFLFSLPLFLSSSTLSTLFFPLLCNGSLVSSLLSSLYSLPSALLLSPSPCSLLLSLNSDLSSASDLLFCPYITHCPGTPCSMLLSSLVTIHMTNVLHWYSQFTFLLSSRPFVSQLSFLRVIWSSLYSEANNLPHRICSFANRLSVNDATISQAARQRIIGITLHIYSHYSTSSLCASS